MNTTLRRLVRVLVISAALMVCLCVTAFAASISCRVNTTTKVYKSPSTSSASIKVAKNTRVTMTAYNGSWALVTRDGVKAYIPIKYLTLTNRLTAYTSTSTAMYKSASSSSSKLGTLAKGTKIYINGRDGSYFRVQNSSGSITGYVKISNVTSKKPSGSSSGSSSDSSSSSSSGSSSSGKYSPSMSNSQKIEYVISVAESLKGKPYSSSANPPSSFDCSRYVKYCFGQADVKLSGTAKTQGYDTSHERITSISSLKRGDVVVFNTNASDDDLSDHTGIYLGSGYFIHASSSAGKVIVSSLSSGYYKRVFSWGLRIFG